MTHRNPELSGLPRSKFLRLQAMALKIKASSGLTSGCNSKLVKGTTGEDLIWTSFLVASTGSEAVAGANLILLKHPVPDALCWTLQWFPTGHFWQGTVCSTSHAVVEKEPLCFFGKASLCMTVAVCMCSQHASRLVKTPKCTEHRTSLCVCLHTLTKLSLRWQLILNDVLKKATSMQ